LFHWLCLRFCDLSWSVCSSFVKFIAREGDSATDCLPSGSLSGSTEGDVSFVGSSCEGPDAHGADGCILASVDDEVRSRDRLSEYPRRDDARIAGSSTLFESVT
jgi:hypothetical protein